MPRTLCKQIVSRSCSFSARVRQASYLKDLASTERDLAEQNFVEGIRTSPVDESETFYNIDPGTGKVIGTFGGSGPKEVERAIKSSVEAFEVWSNWSAADRSGVLRRAALLMKNHVHEIARAESIDTGG